MSQNVLKPSEVKVPSLKFSDPRKLPNGGNMVYVNNGFGPLYVQTPKANVLWDTKYYADNDTGGKYSIQFSMSGMDSNKTMKDFHDMLVAMDTRIVAAAYENRKDWFGAKFNKSSQETIESLYTPMCKVHIDKETGEPSGRFPPSFGFKIVKREGVHQCKVYDDNRTLFNVDDESSEGFKSLAEDVLIKNASMNVLLRCNGIWIINGKFGCTWRAEQLKVKVPESAISGYAFRDDDDDIDVIEDVVQDTVESVSKSDVESDSDDDSDDSDSEDDEPVTPPPSSKGKKRSVKKQ